MEAQPWKASGWLGICTAGLLWTPLHDEATFENNIGNLCERVARYFSPIGVHTAAHVHGSAVNADRVGEAEVTFHKAAASQEVRQTLDRLKADLHIEDAAGPDDDMLADAAFGLATLPAEVPMLPMAFRKNPEMAALKAKVLDVASGPRIGFFGMGGAGKTVTSTYVVRSEQVRHHFDHICWVTFGQQPVVPKLQALVHQQLTGRQLSPHEEEESRKQSLMDAMHGKRILLVLDDLWDSEFERSLDFIDAEAGGKALISTRVKSLLTEQDSLQVQLPTESEAAQILMAAAGTSAATGRDRRSQIPSEVFEVVKLCGRLPLALEMAGRLIAGFSLDVGQSWRGVPEAIEEQLQSKNARAGNSTSTGIEDRLVTASLESLQESPAVKSRIKQLFSLFALVPEDTYLGPDAMLIMFNAVFESGESGKQVSQLKLRMYTQTLINRSLILGTVERPQLHDIIRDYTVASWSPEELQAAHQKVVDAFSQCRASQIYGWNALDRSELGAYVVNEISHHVRAAFEPDRWRANESFIAWVDSVPDVIADAAWDCLSAVDLGELIEQGAAAGDVFSTALRLNAKGAWLKRVAQAGTEEQMLELCPRFAAVVDSLFDPPPPPDQRRARESIAVRLLSHILGSRNMSMITEYYLPRIDQFVGSDAMYEDALGIMFAQLGSGMRDVINPTGPMHDQWPEMVNTYTEVFVKYLGVQQSSTDSILRDQMAIVSVGCFTVFRELIVPNEGWDPQLLTPSDVQIALRVYNYDRAHQLFMDKGFGDPFCNAPVGAYAALGFGALDCWDASVDFCCKNFMRSVADSSTRKQEIQNHFYYSGLWGGAFLNVLLNRADVARRCFRAAGFSWGTIDAAYDAAPAEVVGTWRPRGSTATTHLITAEAVCLCSKLAWVLACTDDELPPVGQFLGSLLPAAELAKSLMPNPYMSIWMNGNGSGANAIVLAALACERYGAECWAAALSYCDQAMVTDMQKGGGDVPTDRALACLVRGRVRAAQGQTPAAKKSFEDAVRETKRNGYKLLEAVAYDARRKLLLGQGMAEGAREAAERETCEAGLEAPPDRLRAFLDA
eukprot:SAG22_NODE_115_length_19315_cov_10.458368_9_plen_1069_part_00